jgi:anti-sigma B factor antagonist
MVFSASQRDHGGEGIVLEVSGELDMSAVDAFRQAVAEAAVGAAFCSLDLTAVTFMDSAGLGALVAAHRDAVDAGAVVAVRPSPPVLRLLGVAGLLHHFALDPPAPTLPDPRRR